MSITSREDYQTLTHIVGEYHKLLQKNDAMVKELLELRARLQLEDTSSTNQEVEDTHNIWSVMHHPEKPEHGEEDELIQSGEYWMYTRRKSTPLKTVESVQEGDEVYMRVRTSLSSTGGILKNPKYTDYYRKGKVIQAPRERAQEFNPQDTRPGWYCMKIDWSSDLVSASKCSYKNASQKTITLQN